MPIRKLRFYPVLLELNYIWFHRNRKKDIHTKNNYNSQFTWRGGGASSMLRWWSKGQTHFRTNALFHINVGEGWDVRD